jgi:HlyD family secretion protein
MAGKGNLIKWIKRSKIRVAVLIAAVLAVAVAIFALGGEESYAEVNPVRRDIATYYSFSGNITAGHTQSVLATGSEPVKKFYVEEKAQVQTGDLLVEFKNDTLLANIVQSKVNVELAQINYEKAMGTTKTEKTRQAENALTTAQMNFNTAEADLARIKQFYENGISSKTELDAAQKSYDTTQMSLSTAQSDRTLLETTLEQDIRTSAAQLAQSQASLANLEQQLADSKIYATISGTVSEIYVNLNEQVMNGSAIMDIIDYEHLEVEIKVDEYGLTTVSVGTDVQVNVNAYGETVRGTIAKLSESATVENGVSYFPATIALEPNAILRVGMSVEIKVVNEQAQGVIAIPMSAVRTDSANRAYVLVKDSAGKAQTQFIATGINDGMFIEVKEGLEEGATVLLAAGVGIPATTTTETGGMTGGARPPGGGGGGVRIQQR